MNEGGPLGVAIPKEGTIAITNALAVPKTARSKAFALEFINFYLEAAQQEAWARKIYYGPTNREVTLPREYAARVPVGAEAIGRLRFPDEDYLAKHRGEWVERWNKEVYREVPEVNLGICGPWRLGCYGSAKQRVEPPRRVPLLLLRRVSVHG